MCVACKVDAPKEYIDLSNNILINERYGCSDNFLYCKHCGCVLISGPELGIDNEEHDE